MHKTLEGSLILLLMNMCGNAFTLQESTCSEQERQ